MTIDNADDDADLDRDLDRLADDGSPHANDESGRP